MTYMPKLDIAPSSMDGIEYTINGATPRYNTIMTEVSTLTDGGGHWGYPDFPPNRDCGGPFIKTGIRTTFGATESIDAWRGGPLKQHYSGCFRAQVSGIAGTISSVDGTAWGVEAYSRMKPTKPSFQALNSLYELREVPAMLKQRFHFNDLKSLGDFHLALQFGWLALLRDCRNLYNAQQRMEKRLAWLLRHNGRPVRTRVDLMGSQVDNAPVSGEYYGNLYPILVTQYYRRVPTHVEQTWTTDKVWASAQFRYWLPPGPRGIVWRTKMKAALFGLNPSPSVVWNAMPWTWLSDWFVNVGGLLENLDVGVANRLAADYYYVMREICWHRRRDSVGHFKDNAGRDLTVSGSALYEKFRKTRLHGDPFGLNTNQASLSGMQLSILGALGLSKVR